MAFKFKTKFVDCDGCEFKTGRYRNGNLALQVVSETEGPICVCTVNPGVPVADDRIAVKDYSENEGVADALARLGIIGEKEEVIPSGWVQITVYRLTEHGKEIFAKELAE